MNRMETLRIQVKTAPIARDTAAMLTVTGTVGDTETSGPHIVNWWLRRIATFEGSMMTALNGERTCDKYSTKPQERDMVKRMRG
jgi:hypothetical protein